MCYLTRFIGLLPNFYPRNETIVNKLTFCFLDITFTCCTMHCEIVLLAAILSSSFAVRNYEYSPLYEAFQNALVNDTSNLVKLQSLLYPPEYNLESSVYTAVRFNPCDFKVRKIDSYQEENQSRAFISCTNFSCRDCDELCYTNSSLIFVLHVDGHSNSHFKLFYFVRSLWNILVVIESASFEMFNYMTNSKVDIVSYNGGQVVNLTLKIDQLEKMPSNRDVEDTLLLILSWVC